MWSDTVEYRQLVREVSKQVVADVAPEELDLFDPLVDEYFQDPAMAQAAGSETPDDPLGFGLSDTVVAVVPAAAAMVHSVFTHLENTILKPAPGESAETLKMKIRMLFRQQPLTGTAAPAVDDLGIPPLTREQLEQVMQVARRTALRYGVDPEEASLMATSLVGSLAQA